MAACYTPREYERNHPGGALRRGWYLVGVAIASLAIAGGVMAADRAIDAAATRVDVVARNASFTPADVRVRSGQFVVVSFTNADPVFHDWEVEGVANIDAGARPGQTQRIRFLAPAPGPIGWYAPSRATPTPA